jgi:hypothetical protein
MGTKRLSLIVVFGISIMLAACTPPEVFLPAGFANEVKSGDEAETAAPTETVEPTKTVQPTETVDPTETQAATGTPEATEEASRAGCPGNPGGIPPEAGKIAATYQVSEAEVMGWFCKGFGFGEIKNAYLWASKSGKTVAELFTLRQQGMGWGEIVQSLDIQPGNKPCWAGPDHGANDPNCVKPGSSNKSGEHGNGNGGHGGNGKNGKP